MTWSNATGHGWAQLNVVDWKNPKNFEGSKPKKFQYANHDQPTQVQAVVVVFGVVGLIGVDDEQSRSPEMSSVACSSEIKEDGLRFVLRRNEER